MLPAGDLGPGDVCAGNWNARGRLSGVICRPRVNGHSHVLYTALCSGLGRDLCPSSPLLSCAAPKRHQKSPLRAVTSMGVWSSATAEPPITCYLPRMHDTRRASKEKLNALDLTPRAWW